MTGVPVQRGGRRSVPPAPVLQLPYQRPGLLRRVVAAVRAGAADWRRSGTA